MVDQSVNECGCRILGDPNAVGWWGRKRMVGWTTASLGLYIRRCYVYQDVISLYEVWVGRNPSCVLENARLRVLDPQLRLVPVCVVGVLRKCKGESDKDCSMAPAREGSIRYRVKLVKPALPPCCQLLAGLSEPYEALCLAYVARDSVQTDLMLQKIKATKEIEPYILRHVRI